MGASQLTHARLPVARWIMLCGLTLAGCFVNAGDVSTARDLAGEYLEALEGGRADRGWSLILPDSRRAYQDLDQYVTLAEETDWDEFSWQFVQEGDYCEDGGVYCSVRIDIAGVPGSVPPFLLESPESNPDDTFLTLRVDDDPQSVGNAEIVVYFSPGGDRGILLGGG